MSATAPNNFSRRKPALRKSSERGAAGTVVEVAGRSYILATAGHVDHGKSALIKALTGTDPDRLPEEKARGITIDLGFAYLRLPTAEGELHVGIVDVPGHEDFVRNMVAGVGAIDATLLVVAADDGWMPQTEEHLQILSYLRVSHAVVALTKVDLPCVDAQAAAERIRLQLSDSPFAAAPIIPTSTITGVGLQELKAALAGMLALTPPARDIGKPRLSIDRVFTLHGIGTVATGSLVGGMLRRGQSVIVEPGAHPARIRSIQSFNRDVEVSYPGMRTAVNLPDVPVGPAGTDFGLQRGQVIAEFKHASRVIDVQLERSRRLLNRIDAAGRPLKNGAIVRLHHGAANVPGRVQLCEAVSLGPGESCIARLLLEKPFCVMVGDRFVVRDWSEQVTLAGGMVLDVDAAANALKRADHRELLQQRCATPNDLDTFVRTQVARDRAVRRSGLLLRSNFSAAEIETAVGRLSGAGQLEICGDWVVAGPWWREMQQRAAALIRAAHDAHPERAGLSLNALRQQMDMPAPELFDLLLAALCRNDHVQDGASVRHSKHQPALPPHLESAGKKVLSLLAAKPLDPPSRGDLAPDRETQQALRFLVQAGEAVELSEDIVLLSEHYHAASDVVVRFLREKGSATVSDLRQALGASRRIVVPLLERLDKEGVTIRRGDRRVVKT